MTRDNLRAKLEDIFRLSIEEKIEAYEELLRKAEVGGIEKFKTKDENEVVVFEVRRRIDLLRLLAADLGMKNIAQRANVLLDQLE